MARLRFMAVALLALALAGNSAQTGRSEGKSDGPTVPSRSYPESETIKVVTADDRSCVIYSLTELGYDADLGRWIAQTIPEMIESKSWQQSGGSGVLRYYAPKNIFIVNNSTEIQTKVNGFLKNLKTSLPKTKHASVATTKKSSHSNVLPADYRAPALMGTSGPLPEPSGYPVPAPVKAPKHLFHFLIRYEGEGIIDDNVVKLMKIQNQGGNSPILSRSWEERRYSGPASGVSSNPPSTLASPEPVQSPPVAQPKQKEDTKDEKKGESGEKPQS